MRDVTPVNTNKNTRKTKISFADQVEDTNSDSNLETEPEKNKETQLTPKEKPANQTLEVPRLDSPPSTGPLTTNLAPVFTAPAWGAPATTGAPALEAPAIDPNIPVHDQIRHAQAFQRALAQRNMEAREEREREAREEKKEKKNIQPPE